MQDTIDSFLEELDKNQETRAKARFAMESASRIDGFSEGKSGDDFGAEDFERLISLSETRGKAIGRGLQRRKSLADDMDLTEIY